MGDHVQTSIELTLGLSLLPCLDALRMPLPAGLVSGAALRAGQGVHTLLQHAVALTTFSGSAQSTNTSDSD